MSQRQVCVARERLERGRASAFIRPGTSRATRSSKMLVELLELHGYLLCLLPRGGKLALVLSPVGSVEDRDAVDERPIGGVALLNRVDEKSGLPLPIACTISL